MFGETAPVERNDPAVYAVVDDSMVYQAEEFGRAARQLTEADYYPLVFIGGQGTGKSTLLNAAFATQFGERQGYVPGQTTRGINGAIVMNNGRIYVLFDAEGTDTGQNIARRDTSGDSRIALWALGVSHVVCMNVYDTDVGRDSASQMHLLECLFEARLNLRRGIEGLDLGQGVYHIIYIIHNIIYDDEEETKNVINGLETRLMMDARECWNRVVGTARTTSVPSMESCFNITILPLAHYRVNRNRYMSQARELPSMLPQVKGEVPLRDYPMYGHSVWNVIANASFLDITAHRETFLVQQINERIDNARENMRRRIEDIKPSDEVNTWMMNHFVRISESIRGIPPCKVSAVADSQHIQGQVAKVKMALSTVDQNIGRVHLPTAGPCGNILSLCNEIAIQLRTINETMGSCRNPPDTTSLRRYILEEISQLCRKFIISSSAAISSFNDEVLSALPQPGGIRHFDPLQQSDAPSEYSGNYGIEIYRILAGNIHSYCCQEMEMEQADLCDLLFECCLDDATLFIIFDKVACFLRNFIQKVAKVLQEMLTSVACKLRDAGIDDVPEYSIQGSNYLQQLDQKLDEKRGELATLRDSIVGRVIGRVSGCLATYFMPYGLCVGLEVREQISNTMRKTYSVLKQLSRGEYTTPSWDAMADGFTETSDKNTFVSNAVDAASRGMRFCRNEFALPRGENDSLLPVSPGLIGARRWVPRVDLMDISISGLEESVRIVEREAKDAVNTVFTINVCGVGMVNATFGLGRQYARGESPLDIRMSEFNKMIHDAEEKKKDKRKKVIRRTVLGCTAGLVGGLCTLFFPIAVPVAIGACTLSTAAVGGGTYHYSTKDKEHMYIADHIEMPQAHEASR